MYFTHFIFHSTVWSLPLIYAYRPWSNSPRCISPPNPIIHRIISFFTVFTHKTLFHHHAIVLPSFIISPVCMDFMTKYHVLQGYQVRRAAMNTQSILQRQDFIDRGVNEAAESNAQKTKSAGLHISRWFQRTKGTYQFYYLSCSWRFPPWPQSQATRAAINAVWQTIQSFTSPFCLFTRVLPSTAVRVH